MAVIRVVRSGVWTVSGSARWLGPACSGNWRSGGVFGGWEAEVCFEARGWRSGGGWFWTETFMMIMDCFYSKLFADLGYWLDKH